MRRVLQRQSRLRSAHADEERERPAGAVVVDVLETRAGEAVYLGHLGDVPKTQLSKHASNAPEEPLQSYSSLPNTSVVAIRCAHRFCRPLCATTNRHGKPGRRSLCVEDVVYVR